RTTDLLIHSQLSSPDRTRQIRSLDPRETPTIPGLLPSYRDLSATRPDTTRHGVCVTPALARFGQFRATIIFQLAHMPSCGALDGTGAHRHFGSRSRMRPSTWRTGSAGKAGRRSAASRARCPASCRRALIADIAY